MKTLQLRKRLATLGVMVIGATLMSLSLMLAGFSLDHLGVLSDEVQVSAATAVTDSNNIQPSPLAAEVDPMADSYHAFESMSPAEALTNGKPSLFVFQPYELCQSRYCRNPVWLADELQAGYQDRVNFVYVTTYAMSDYDDPEPYPPLLYDNWDLYSVAPYSTWLPRPTMTEFGLSLEAPVIVLTDGQANPVYYGGEFFEIAEIGPLLKDVLHQ